MEKEFEALEKIDNTLCLNNNRGNLEFAIDTEEHIDCASVTEMTECLETIKQALTELKAIKEAKPSEALIGELETLEELLNGFIKNKIIDKAFTTIKQALLKAQENEKVLEIIKEKGVNVGEFKKELDWDKFDYSFYLCYYKRFSIEELTKEEFDLVKRWSEK